MTNMKRHHFWLSKLPGGVTESSTVFGSETGRVPQHVEETNQIHWFGGHLIVAYQMRFDLLEKKGRMFSSVWRKCHHWENLEQQRGIENNKQKLRCWLSSLKVNENRVSWNRIGTINWPVRSVLHDPFSINHTSIGKKHQPFAWFSKAFQSSALVKKG